jgi:hypothetical protein
MMLMSEGWLVRAEVVVDSPGISLICMLMPVASPPPRSPLAARVSPAVVDEIKRIIRESKILE